MTRKKLANILMIVVTALCSIALLLSGYGGLCDPRQWGFFPAVMVLLLPVSFIVTMLWTIVMACLRKWKLVAPLGVTLLLALTRTCGIFPVTLFNNAPQNSDSTFTVMTYNVAAFNHFFTTDSCSVMRTILDINADIVLMQEMPHCDLDFKYDTVRGLKPYHQELDRKYPYRSYTHCDEVAILSKYPFTIDTIVAAKKGYDTLNYLQDLKHYPALAYDVVVKGHNVRLINTHLQSYGLSNADKSITGTDTSDDFDVMQGSTVETMSMTEKLSRAFSLRADDAQALRNAIDKGPETVIVCGDFNDVPGSYSYRTVAGNDMDDAWTECGMGYAHTYSKHRFYFKIDHILYRGNIKAVDAQIYGDIPETYTSSDHYPQTAKFEFVKK